MHGDVPRPVKKNASLTVNHLISKATQRGKSKGLQSDCTGASIKRSAQACCYTRVLESDDDDPNGAVNPTLPARGGDRGLVRGGVLGVTGGGEMGTAEGGEL